MLVYAWLSLQKVFLYKSNHHYISFQMVSLAKTANQRWSGEEALKAKVSSQEPENWLWYVSFFYTLCWYMQGQAYRKIIYIFLFTIKFSLAWYHLANVADQSWSGEEALKAKVFCKNQKDWLWYTCLFINHVGTYKVNPTVKLFIYYYSLLNFRLIGTTGKTRCPV